jgi:hypothetical protein
VEPGLGQVITVNEKIRLATAFAKAKNCATASTDELVIACHGYMAPYVKQGKWVPKIAWRGGYGLEFCQESLTLNNISKVSALNGYFKTIWLMACAPAGKGSKNSPLFCRQFAKNANAYVIASDKTQLYQPGYSDNARKMSIMVLQFGKWEGNVYKFWPNGTVWEKLNKPCAVPLP